MNPENDNPNSLRWILAAVLSVVLALVIYNVGGMLATARDAALPPREAELPFVEVADAQAMPPIYHIVEEGFLRARAEIAVVPEVSGKVVEVADQLEPGGRFKTGELMFRVDPRTFEADLARAKADIAAARSEVARARAENERQARLEGIGASAKSRREQAAANYASARARLGQAEAALIAAQKRMDDTAVTAPFDAAVISETVALGGFVQPGQSAATIYDTGAGEIVLGLLPADAQAVRRAVQQNDGPTPVVITPSRASASQGTINGTVKRFGSAVDSRSRTVPVVVEVPDAFNGDGIVFANDFVRVELPAMAEQSLFGVPHGAVREERFVWSLDDDNRLHAVKVTQLERIGDLTIIESAEVLSGRRVVTTALTEESEGLQVQVADRSGGASTNGGGETAQ